MLQHVNAVRVRRHTQRHLHTQLGGAGDRTSNLLVTSQPALPPELLPPMHMPLYAYLEHMPLFSQWWRRTYRRDLALDVVQQLLLSPAEEGVLELCVVLLWLQQPAMLHVHHLPEPV